MATHLKVVLFTCLLFLMVFTMGEVKPVLAKQGEQLKQRTKVLEASVKELQEKLKEQEETIKEQGEKVKELKGCNGKYTQPLRSCGRVMLGNSGSRLAL